jgi:polynucleotide 5'-hydroxyl-kinase GRC3/NOL9
LLISGPASLRLEKGSAEIFGAPLRLKRRLIIKSERQLPIEIVDDSILEAEVGERASYLEVDGSTVPDSWYSAAEALQKPEMGKAVVIGSTDTGKSTFCTFLANHQLRLGRRFAVIDADIGQSDLGPPGSLGLSIIDKPLIELEDSRVDAMIFIGETSPSSVVDKVIHGILKLESRIPMGTPTVINTDGWVANDEAVAFKVMMIRKLKPASVLGLAEGSELKPILEKTSAPVVRIQAPKFIKVRSREERKRLREYGYMRYLRKAIHRNFSLEKIKTENLLAARCGGGEILGFLDEEGFLIGIGILEHLNRTRRMLRAYTNVPPRGVAEIACGSVRLSLQGMELD